MDPYRTTLGLSKKNPDSRRKIGGKVENTDYEKSPIIGDKNTYHQTEISITKVMKSGISKRIPITEEAGLPKKLELTYLLSLSSWKSPQYFLAQDDGAIKEGGTEISRRSGI
jgi:hypothetical protein